MSSLSARILVSVSVLLLFFFGVTIIVLDSAFREAGEQAQEDILDGHLMAILAAAEPAADGGLAMPPDLLEPRFGSIDSGLYAQLEDESGAIIWRSRSALGSKLPAVPATALGQRLFEKRQMDNGTPLLTLSLAVQWEFPDGQLRPFTFHVSESLGSFNAQVARFRRQLFGWFAAVAMIMLLSISLLLRGLLRPLRRIEHQIQEIEEGDRRSLSGNFPTELTGVAKNMNYLIDSERSRSDRYRVTLDNLAHSLKTPLAAVRALLEQGKADRGTDKINEQVDRMDEIVRYQLRKPATGSTDSILYGRVDVAAELQRLIDGLRKVHRDKNPDIVATISDGAVFRGDKGDFLEMTGNLLDNACKWCRRTVAVDVATDPATHAVRSIRVADDGPGIPEGSAADLLERGTRLDESTPGHGIGLAIVKDLAESYGGSLSIAASELGGAEITLRVSASSRGSS